jgi:hypothetical protein
MYSYANLTTTNMILIAHIAPVPGIVKLMTPYGTIAMNLAKAHAPAAKEQDYGNTKRCFDCITNIRHPNEIWNPLSN